MFFRSIQLFTAVLVFSLSCTSLRAEESFFDQFIDDDGYLDTSDWLDRGGFLPVPIIVTEPAVDNGLGAAALFIHQDEDDPERKHPPSITGAAGLLTGNNSWLAAAFHRGIWFEDRVRYTGALAQTSINLNYYGTSEDPIVGNEGFSYNMDGFFLLQDIRARLWDSNLFLGADYQLFSSDASFKFADDPPGVTPKSLDSTNAGLGAVLYYDSRDNIFTPNHGWEAKLNTRYYGPAVGGDFDYLKLEGVSNAYFDLGEEWKLGWQVKGAVVGDDAPFFARPFIELRGIPAVRYQDNAIAQTEVEARWQFHPRWAGIAFGGVGTAANDASDWSSSKRRYTKGMGFRYLIAKELGLQVGADVAKGPEDTVFYIQIGSAWAR
ncbi:BamA/TamA family outer membrane protein [Rhodovibrionaceae bacterium A322]